MWSVIYHKRTEAELEKSKYGVYRRRSAYKWIFNGRLVNDGKCTGRQQKTQIKRRENVLNVKNWWCLDWKYKIPGMILSSQIFLWKIHICVLNTTYADEIWLLCTYKYGMPINNDCWEKITFVGRPTDSLNMNSNESQAKERERKRQENDVKWTKRSDTDINLIGSEWAINILFFPSYASGRLDRFCLVVPNAYNPI